ncbi:hypothetical protein K1T71_000959 [Dendrolimus kikuchii]|uniref:Uncharacterized protein n=1 Tax=Dendrolimus kikuchii TaxID=765133 RepID=A0ACC1DH61_9NEOP|nr:hypothetical protein K1T71_000959 [Dendrolimus kikuchii]
MRDAEGGVNPLDDTNQAIFIFRIQYARHGKSISIVSVDNMVLEKYSQVSPERYRIISERYERFVEHLDDPRYEPVKVFDPLSEKHLKEIELIREVSKNLQAKKEEDVAKAAQAKLAEEEAAKREAEQKAAEEKKKEEDAEENKDEPPKIE